MVPVIYRIKKSRNKVMANLIASGVSIHFGGVVALSEVNLEVPEGSIIGLIGPNGAGKTTFFNCISRFLHYSSGTIKYGDKDLKNYSPHHMVRIGIARTFQNINLFKSRTVLDNILIGMHRHIGNPVSAMLSLPRATRRERSMRRKAEEIAGMLDIKEEIEQLVRNLPYGIQKRVELARAIAAEPELILLDEPVAGCNEEETSELCRRVNYINRELNITILLVEHDMSMVMSVCKYIYVLDFGKNIAEGSPDEIQSNPAVIEAYLGEKNVA